MALRVARMVCLLLVVVVAAGCTTPPGVVSRKLPGDLAEVVVVRVEIDPEEKAQKVVLQEKEGRRFIPIFIALPEAEAIQRVLEAHTTPRPMTHDLAANLVGALGGKLERVVIELEDRTFVATLVIKKGLGTVQMDSRASDALALALRTKSSIFVSETLLNLPTIPPEPAPEAP